MKKLLICALLLALVLSCAATALGEIGDRLSVANCSEYITLREEPDTSAASLAKLPLGAEVDEVGWAENGFRKVSYQGQTGYALASYLSVTQTYRGSEVKLGQAQRYNINLFLSNFTEAGFVWPSGCYDKRWVDAALLTRFAIDHCWFNRQNRLEWGEYFNDNNVRLPKSQIAPIVQKYFGLDIKPSERAPYMDYRDGYYYWQETGGHTNDGFACLDRVEALGWNRYSVWFNIYGMGEAWTNDMCYYTQAQARKVYPVAGLEYTGRAVINTGSTGLEDRSGWSLERFTVDRDF